MPVPSGANDTPSGHGVITAAPGVAHFEGVWLVGEAGGRLAASPNVRVVLDDSGLSVTGPSPGQSNTVPWTWVQRFGPGSPMSFPDGSPATVVEVELVGRTVSLLVPPDQLRADEVEELNHYVPERPRPPASPVPPLPSGDLESERAVAAHETERTDDPGMDRTAGPQTDQTDEAEVGRIARAQAERTAEDRADRAAARTLQEAPEAELDAPGSEDTAESDAGSDAGSPGIAGEDAQPTEGDAEPTERHAQAEQVDDDESVAVEPRRRVSLGVLLAVLVALGIGASVVTALRIGNDGQSPGTGVVIPQSVPTTYGAVPSMLEGPAPTVSSRSVAAYLELSQGDLPSGWTRAPAASTSSVTSPFTASAPGSDARLASCLGLPIAQVGMITGRSEPGGSRVWPSPVFDMAPALQPSSVTAVTTLVSSAAAERSDLASLLRTGATHCLASYYASTFASQGLTSAPLANLFEVPQRAGVEAIGLEAHVDVSQSGRPAVYDYDVVVIGAGRAEVTLGAQQLDEPFSSDTLDHAVQSLEARAAIAAAAH